MPYTQKKQENPPPDSPLDSNFTPVFDRIVEQQGNTAANVYGAVWRHCQMHDHVCHASLRTLADQLGLNQSTVLRHLKRLVHYQYLDDLTPKLRHRPHSYQVNRIGPGAWFYNGMPDARAMKQSKKAAREASAPSSVEQKGPQDEPIPSDAEDARRAEAQAETLPPPAPTFQEMDPAVHDMLAALAKKKSVSR